MSRWLLRFENALSVHDVKDDAARISWLLMLLGTAGDSLIDATRPPGQTYAQFRALVLQRLLPPLSLTALQAQLDALLCTDGDFQDLSLRVQNITNRMYGGCPPAIQRAHETRAFIQATPLPIQAHLSLFDYANVDEAVAAAYRKDRNLMKFASPVVALAGVDAASFRGDGGGSKDEEAKSINEIRGEEQKDKVAAVVEGARFKWERSNEEKERMMEQITKLKKEIEQLKVREEKQRPQRTIECWNCHQEGHLWKNCPYQQGGRGRGRGRGVAGNPQMQPSIGWGPQGYQRGPQGYQMGQMRPPMYPAMWMGPVQPQFNRAYQSEPEAEAREGEQSQDHLALPWHEEEELLQYVQLSPQEKIIKLQKQQGALYIPINIHDQNVPFLLDTGATRSIMSERLYNRWHKSIGPLHASPVKVMGATREELALKGETPAMAVKICDQIFLVKFLVAKCEPSNGILGTDVLQPLRAVVDVGSGQMWSAQSNDEVRVAAVHTHQAVQVEGRKETNEEEKKKKTPSLLKRL